MMHWFGRLIVFSVLCGAASVLSASCDGQSISAAFVLTVPRSSLKLAVNMMRQHLRESGLPRSPGQKLSIFYHSRSFSDISSWDGYFARLDETGSEAEATRFLADLDNFADGSPFSEEKIKFVGRVMDDLSLLNASFFGRPPPQRVMFISEGIPLSLAEADSGTTDKIDTELVLRLNKSAAAEGVWCEKNGIRTRSCFAMGNNIDQVDQQITKLLGKSEVFVELLNYSLNRLQDDLASRMILSYYTTRLSSPENLLLLKPVAGQSKLATSVPVLSICDRRKSAKKPRDVAVEGSEGSLKTLAEPVTGSVAFSLNIALIVVALGLLVCSLC